MDPNSKVYGETEECDSSESGWTMYIGSPFYGDDDNDHSVDNDGANVDDDRGKGYNREDEGDSDDSMASDASSGPSHQGTGSLKHKVDGKKQGNGGESEEASKPIMERQRVNDEKKIRGNNISNPLSGHQSGSIKVRNNFLSCKRK